MFRQIIHIITIILFIYSHSSLIAVLAPIVLRLQFIILIKAVQGPNPLAARIAAAADVVVKGLRSPVHLDCIVIIPDSE